MIWEQILSKLREMGYSGAETVEAVVAWLKDKFGTIEVEVPVEVPEAPPEVPTVETAAGETVPIMTASLDREQVVAEVPVTKFAKLLEAVFKAKGTQKLSLAAVQRTARQEDRIAQLEAEVDLLGGSPAAKQRRKGLARAGSSGRVRHIQVKERVEDDPAYGFRNDRDFLTGVLIAGRDGFEPAEKKWPGLKYLRVKAAGSDEQSGISDPYGGFLVPETFSPDMLRLEPEEDPTEGRVTRIPMGTPRVLIPARVDKNHASSVSGGLTVTRRTETLAATSSRMEMERIALNATGIFGLSYVTEELLNDSPQSMAAILAQGFQDEFTSELLNERIRGTGTGEFLGILNSPALISVTRSGGANTISYDDIIAIRSRCWRYNRAIWIANHDTLPQLAAIKLSGGTGNVSAWQQRLTEDRPDLLMGRPIFFSEYASALGTAGDLICAVWSEFIEGLLQPMQSAESIHVRFVNHERTFKFWMRNDGRPWWRTALTPKNGANTLSPFLTIAA